MDPTRTINLYRALLREGRKFTNYNFRKYTERRVRDEFRSHKNEVDPDVAMKWFKKAEESLSLLQRQTTLDNMFRVKSSHILTK